MKERLVMRVRNGVVVLMFRGTYYSEEIFGVCFPDIDLSNVKWADISPVSGQHVLEAYITPKEEVVYA